MKNKRKTFEKDMKALLEFVILNNDIPPDSSIDHVILKECCDKNFLTGVKTATMISGRIVCDIAGTPRVTKDGLDFLYPKKI